MGAQTADVKTSMTIPGRSRSWDPFWVRDTDHWLIAAAALIAIFVVGTTIAWWSSRRRKSM